MNDNARVVDDAPPFDPPDNLDDIFGAPEAEEETAFVAPPLVVQEDLELTDTANDVFTLTPSLAEDAAPVSPPVPEAHAAAEEDDEPPFDPPMAGDDGFDDLDDAVLELTNTACAPPAQPTPPAPPQPLPPPLTTFATTRPPPTETRASERPLPAISIFAAYDRPEVGKLLECFAADRRASRAEILVERGGVDAAAVRFTAQPAANLIIVDTTLRRAEMLAGLDRLAPALQQGAKLIVLGALNDVALLRDLAQRGVHEYIVPPIGPDALMRTVCGLYAESDTSRVVAVIGARGGVGASSAAHNIAWSISERQELGATLVDLDLCFGTAAFAFKQVAQQSVTDLLGAIERPLAQHNERLQILTAPAALEPSAAIDEEVMHILIERARRTSPFVVLDLPHAWTGWTRQTLIDADDVVIVAAPDLASLRNAKSIIEALKPARGAKSSPLVALSMVGVPKRPEIMAKDFAEAVGVVPSAALPFDGELFGVSEITGRVVGDIAPDSKAAAAYDALATAITGRAPCRRKAAPSASLRTLSESVESESAALLLTRAAPAPDYLSRAVSAAEDDFSTQRVARRRSAQRSAGRVMAWAAGVAVVVALGAWQWQSRGPVAHAISPAPAPASAAPAPRAEDHYRAALELLNDPRRGAEGVSLVTRAAEAGYAPAQYRLARLYEHGEGVRADRAIARTWTERAAAAGHRRAMHDLGVYYAQGEGVARDDAAAFRWFRQAAEFGVADSQYNLGVLYQEGRGVAVDEREALFWFLTAAAQGDEEAAARAEALSASRTPAELEQARARAQAFTPRAANPAANPAPRPHGAAS